MGGVEFNNLNEQWKLIKDDCVREIDHLFERSDFILGDGVRIFEENFADYIGCKYAVGVSNGTDALKLAVQSLDLKGSSCFLIPAYTYVATLLGPEQACPNATFKLVDCNDYFQMDVDIVKDFVVSNRSRYDNMIIVPVHLYGYTCDMTSLCDIADEYDCIILEDSSQAHGAKWKGKTVGGFGKVSAFSLYPGKNLGAAGDAGIVTTNDENVYSRLKLLRNLGSEKKYVHQIRGGNHRLDTIQAIILNQKLKHLDDWNCKRMSVVSLYERYMDNHRVVLPQNPKYCSPVHHVYPVLVNDRDGFISHLESNNIEYGIHYLIPIEKMPMYSHLSAPNKNALDFSNRTISLPIHPFLGEESCMFLCDAINRFE